MSVLKSGLTLGLSLIMSMGPQNMFLIRQGLKKEYVYLTALICSLCDTLLIVISTTSVSQLIMKYPAVKAVMLVLGVMFLAGYGARSLYSGFKNLSQSTDVDLKKSSSNMTIIILILTTVSFSLLNPQAIVEIMMMIGGVVSQYPQQDHFAFMMGVILASFLWFYAIASVSRLFSSYLKSPKIWSSLEITSGLIMLGFSAMLLSHSMIFA